MSDPSPLPLPPVKPSIACSRTNIPGLYSSTGFDMIGVLARVAQRPNPQVSVGPVDMSCSFIVTEARKVDMPIVYVSETFERLAGYTFAECVGRNCRFLQSVHPDGHVTSGSFRRYTDNATVYNIKQSVLLKRECQYTMINYRKSGEPFINLVTIIPISWDHEDEIAYYIGFQVNLIDQPNSIMNRMKDGTYIVNTPIPSTSTTMPQGVIVIKNVFNGFNNDTHTNKETKKHSNTSTTNFTHLVGVNDIVEAENIFYRTLVEQIDSMHVISLQGILLYVSLDCCRLLEYEADELIGHSLSEYCHPGDLVSVMRELKESSNGVNIINIVYRIRRKYSGYIWIESNGKCAVGEKSKGKKFVVLTGREKHLAQLHKQDVNLTGEISKNDMWSKLSLEGLYLYMSPQCHALYLFGLGQIIGKSMFDFVHIEDQRELDRALKHVQAGHITVLQHRFKTKRGEYQLVKSTFYPGNNQQPTNSHFILHKCMIITIDNNSNDGLEADEKILTMPVTQMENDQDNLFDVLSPAQYKSWQYEVQQLRMQNQRLRNELDEYESDRRKKRIK